MTRRTLGPRTRHCDQYERKADQCDAEPPAERGRRLTPRGNDAREEDDQHAEDHDEVRWHEPRGGEHRLGPVPGDQSTGKLEQNGERQSEELHHSKTYPGA